MLAEDEAPFDEAFCVGIAEGTLDPSEAVKYGVPGKILANFLVAAERFVFSNPPSFGSPEAYERTAKAIHSAV